MSAKTVRKYYNECTEKIHLLLPEVLPVIEELDDPAIFILSIDGTHCPIEEPRPWSEKWSSHKLGKKAGVVYEIALRIQSDDLAWVHGPFPAGTNDVDVFRDRLKGEITTLNNGLSFKKRVRYILTILYYFELRNYYLF